MPDLQPGDGGRRAAAAAGGSPAGQLAVIAQSGGIGFAFFDHGRAKELACRYVVTTGNEACLEALDFADWILDEGKTDVLLLLLEDIKTPRPSAASPRRRCGPASRIIVNKIGQSDAGARAAASHTAALAGSYAAYQAMFQRYGMIEGRDIGEMVDIAHGFLAWGSRLPQGGASASARLRAAAAAGWRTPARPPASRCPSSTPRRARSIDAHLPTYGTSQNPVDATAQAVFKIGYAGLVELVPPSPVVDGIVVVMTARSHGTRAPARGA